MMADNAIPPLTPSSPHPHLIAQHNPARLHRAESDREAGNTLHALGDTTPHYSNMPVIDTAPRERELSTCVDRGVRSRPLSLW